MKTAIEIKFCQNLSKFQDKTEESRRENEESGGNSQPLRQLRNGAVENNDYLRRDITGVPTPEG